MDTHSQLGSLPSTLGSLKNYTRRREVRERCELCSQELLPDHDHLVQTSTRQMLCACHACAVLFSGQTAAKYRRVPRDVRFLSGFFMTDVSWAALNLPINLAFFLNSSAAGRVVALYPSPAGATEALPPPDAWEAILEDYPPLRGLQPDVEALLVNRLDAEPEYFILGIDRCYALVGLIRTHWKGISGSPEVWEEIGRFFTELKGCSRPRETPPHG
jgi:hypothetical protein